MLPTEIRLRIVRFTAKDPLPENSRVLEICSADRDDGVALMRPGLPEPAVYLVN
jgi:hypothetical protein